YTSFGYASGVHAIGGSDAFPNFQNGAVNNRYPLAEAAQDASPSSTAVATYSDSGPLAATAGSQYNQGCSNSGDHPPPPQVCENPNNQVPYARATYPGPPHAHIDSCNGCGDGPRADSDAAQLTASASGYYAGGGTQPFSGAWGQTKTVIDAGGTLTVTTHSEVDSFVIGTVKISKIVVDVTANSSLSGSSGGTSSGCVPTFDVTYLTIYTVAPVKTVDGSHVTIWATGLHIKMTHPSPGPGVPTQSAEYVLGEGFADLQVGTGGPA